MFQYLLHFCLDLLMFFFLLRNTIIHYFKKNLSLKLFHYFIVYIGTGKKHKYLLHFWICILIKYDYIIKYETVVFVVITNRIYYLPIRCIDHSCWHKGQRLFCFTHRDMQQWWNEWLHSPQTTTQSWRPKTSRLFSAWQRRQASKNKNKIIKY